MKKILLTLVLIATTLLGMAQGGDNYSRITPDDADAYIKGNLSIYRDANNQIVYELSDIETRKIHFKKPSENKYGVINENRGIVTFTFEEAKADSPYNIKDKLDFWRWDNDINRWQHDLEVYQAETEMQSSKSIILMLVLDCSSSVENVLKKEKEAAISFLKNFLKESKGSGLIKVGIVSFSTMKDTKVADIKELTNETFPEFESKIRNFTSAHGTALYYAMDLAINGMVQNYIDHKLKNDLLAVEMVTFTDGLDQTSRDPGRDFLTAEQYRQEVKKLKGKMFKIDRRNYREVLYGENPIYNVRLNTHECGLRGIDIETDKQWENMQNIGRELNDDFKPILKISELNDWFTEVAGRLINNWTVLNCHVPNSYSGKVAWIYGGKKKVEKPVLAKNYFFGMNIGAGIGLHKGYFYDYNYYSHNGFIKGIPVTLGIDAAFPVTERFNLGFYLSAGFEIKVRDYYTYSGDNGIRTGIPIDLGPLFIFNLNKGSIYTGFGLHAEPYIHRDSDAYFQIGRKTRNIGGNFRFGYKFKSGFYMFYQFAGAQDRYEWEESYYDEVWTSHGYETKMINRGGHYRFFQSHTFHIGFNFLNKKGKTTPKAKENK